MREKIRISRNENLFKIEELCQENQLVFSDDCFFYECRGQKRNIKVRKTLPQSENAKFRYYSFNDWHVVIEKTFSTIELIYIIKDQPGHHSKFGMGNEGRTFMRVVKIDKSLMKVDFYEKFSHGAGAASFSREHNFGPYVVALTLFPPKVEQPKWQAITEVKEIKIESLPVMEMID